MAAVTVTIIKDGRVNEYGLPLAVGSTYSLAFDLADSLVQAGFAVVSNAAVFDESSTPAGGSVVKSFKFIDGKKSLLAALVTSSTASRTNGLVTVAATGHGITNGTVFVGSRYFFPGCPSLAAGWYDSITEVLTNSLSFTAPGPDFGSQSVNAGAIYTTATDWNSTCTIPAGTLKEDSLVRVVKALGGGTTAATKACRTVVNGNAITPISTLTTTPAAVKSQFFAGNGLSFTDLGFSSTNSTAFALNIAADLTIVERLSVSATADYVVILPGTRVEVYA